MPGLRMAFTSTDVENLEAAIAGGELRVSINGREVQYRSMDDLMRAYNLVRRQVNTSSNPSLRRGRYNPYYDS